MSERSSESEAVYSSHGDVAEPSRRSGSAEDSAPAAAGARCSDPSSDNKGSLSSSCGRNGDGLTPAELPASVPVKSASQQSPVRATLSANGASSSRSSAPAACDGLVPGAHSQASGDHSQVLEVHSRPAVYRQVPETTTRPQPERPPSVLRERTPEERQRRSSLARASWPPCPVEEDTRRGQEDTAMTLQHEEHHGSAPELCQDGQSSSDTLSLDTSSQSLTTVTDESFEDSDLDAMASGVGVGRSYRPVWTNSPLVAGEETSPRRPSVIRAPTPPVLVRRGLQDQGHSDDRQRREGSHEDRQRREGSHDTIVESDSEDEDEVTVKVDPIAERTQYGGDGSSDEGAGADVHDRGDGAHYPAECSGSGIGATAASHAGATEVREEQVELTCWRTCRKNSDDGVPCHSAICDHLSSLTVGDIKRVEPDQAAPREDELGATGGAETKRESFSHNDQNPVAAPNRSESLVVGPPTIAGSDLAGPSSACAGPVAAEAGLAANGAGAGAAESHVGPVQASVSPTPSDGGRTSGSGSPGMVIVTDDEDVDVEADEDLDVEADEDVDIEDDEDVDVDIENGEGVTSADLARSADAAGSPRERVTMAAADSSIPAGAPVPKICGNCSASGVVRMTKIQGVPHCHACYKYLRRCGSHRPQHLWWNRVKPKRNVQNENQPTTTNKQSAIDTDRCNEKTNGTKTRHNPAKRPVQLRVSGRNWSTSEADGDEKEVPRSKRRTRSWHHNGQQRSEPKSKEQRRSGQRNIERSTHRQTTNGQATNEQATNGQATNGQATNGQATNGQTTNGQTTNGQATNGQPTHGQPTHEQQTYYGQLTYYGQATNGQATNGQPTHGQQFHGQPAYGQSTHRQQFHGQPRHGQQTHGQPAYYGQLIYGQATNGQPTHGQQTHGQPTHGQQVHGHPIQENGRHGQQETRYHLRGIEQLVNNLPGSFESPDNGQHDGREGKGRQDNGQPHIGQQDIGQQGRQNIGQQGRQDIGQQGRQDIGRQDIGRHDIGLQVIEQNRTQSYRRALFTEHHHMRSRSLGRAAGPARYLDSSVRGPPPIELSVAALGVQNYPTPHLVTPEQWQARFRVPVVPMPTRPVRSSAARRWSPSKRHLSVEVPSGQRRRRPRTVPEQQPTAHGGTTADGDAHPAPDLPFGAGGERSGDGALLGFCGAGGCKDDSHS